MLSALVKSIVSSLTGDLLGRVEGIFKSYFEGKTTREQLQVELQKALLASFTEVEKSHAEALTKTYQSFMEAAVRNPQLARAWSITLYSQLAVLVWHQLCIPAIAFFGYAYPSSGTTVNWAYALVGGLLGLGPIVLRTGPAKFDVEALKKIVTRR